MNSLQKNTFEDDCNFSPMVIKEKHGFFTGRRWLSCVVSFVLMFVVLAAYIGISLLIGCFCKNAVLSSFISDILCTCVACVFYFKFLRKQFFQGEYKPYGGSLLLGIAFFFCMWFVSQCCAAAIEKTIDDVNMIAYSEIQSQNLGFYLLLSICVAPIAEEFLFRGLIYGIARKSFPSVLSGIFSSVLFALCHGTFGHLPVAFFVGFFSCILLELTGKIRYCAIMHSLYNLISVGLITLVSDKFMNPVFLLISFGVIFGIMIILLHDVSVFRILTQKVWFTLPHETK